MLTIVDITFAAVLAFLATWIIKTFIRFFKVINFLKNGAENMKEINSILQRCYNMFPKEIVQFNGKTFKRGSRVRMVTTQRKIIEGELVGMNSDSVICIITSSYIVAHDINNIKEMNFLDDKDK